MVVATRAAKLDENSIGEQELPNRNRAHVPALDGVRGLAILAVLAFHLNGQIQYRFQGRAATDTLTRLVLAISNMGWIGVDLLFVLSGFLITGILIDARSSPNYYGAFYVRRSLRIFPLYFGFLIFCLLIAPAASLPTTAGFASAVQHQWYLWTYCSNFGAAFKDIQFGPLSHFWSLAVEEHFYLVWPFLVRAVPRNRLYWLCALCVVVAVAARLGFLLAGFSEAAHVLMPSRLDAFGVGGLTAAAVREASSQDARRRMSRALIAGSMVSLLVLVFVHSLGGRFGAIAGATIRYLCLAVSAAGLVWLASTQPDQRLPVRLLNWRPLRALGKYSYGLYVLHVPMIPVVYAGMKRVLAATHAQVGSELAFLAIFDLFGTFCVVLAAMASYHLFEKHFLKLKARFRYECV